MELSGRIACLAPQKNGGSRVMCHLLKWHWLCIGCVFTLTTIRFGELVKDTIVCGMMNTESILRNFFAFI